MFHSPKLFLTRLVSNYGSRFCWLLTSVYLGLKGPVYQMTGSAQLPYFKSIGVTGQMYQSYGTVAMTPWAMKAAIGMISDSLPVFGYHKKPYMIGASVFGSIALALLASVKLSASAAHIAAVLLMCVSLQLAVVDLLTEGTYAAMIAIMPETGSDLVSFVWGLYMIGSFVGSSVAGPLADYFNPRIIFWVCLPLALQVVGTSTMLPEEQLPRNRRGFRSDKIREHPQIFWLGIAMTSGAICLAIVALFFGPDAQSSTSIGLSVILCVLACLWLPRTLAKANLYMFLASALYVNIGGASDFWFTAGPECVPNGPHFSYVYYITYASLVGSAAGMVGVALFQAFLSQGTFRRAFCTTLLLKLVASLFDLFIITRDNIRFGIPDKVAFMLGDAIIYQVAIMLDFMPAVVLTAASCPKGMEATVYALLAGFQNFGSGVARGIGVGLLEKLGVKTTKPCNFENLPLALILGHIVLPLLCVPLIFVLIPDKLMTEKLFDDDTADDEERASEQGADPVASSEAALEETDDSVHEVLMKPATPPIDVDVDSIYTADSDTDGLQGSYQASDAFASSAITPSFRDDDVVTARRSDQRDGPPDNNA